MRGKLNPAAVMRVLVLLALQYVLSCEASFQLPHVMSVGKHLKPFGFRPGPLSHYKGKVGPILGPSGPPRGILEPWQGLFGQLSAGMFGPRFKRGRKLLVGNGGPKPGTRFGPGGPGSAYNPVGSMTANNPVGPISAYNPGGPISAYNPSGPISAYNPSGPISAYNPSGPMTAYNPGGPMTAYNPGGPVSAYNPSGPMTAYNPGSPVSAYNPGGPKSGVGASRPRGPFGEGGGNPYRVSGRRRGRNDVRGDGPRGFADKSDIGSVYSFGPQSGSDLALARGFDLGLSGDFDGTSNLMGRQNDDFLRRAGMGSGIGNYLGTLGVGDNNRYRYTWDFSRDADLRNTGYRDNWRFGNDFDYYGDNRERAGRMGGRPGSYQWNGWSMTGLDGYDDVNGYSGYGNRRRGWRRDQYGRRGMRRARGSPGYRRYDRNDRGYDSYDYDITRNFVSGNDRGFGSADGNWDGYYSISGSGRSSRGRRSRGGGRKYESDIGKSGPRSKDEFKYRDNGYTKIISENYIYENNGRSGKTRTSESSVDRGYNIGGDGNTNGNGLLFADGNDGFRKNSVDQGGLSDGFVDRSVDNIGGPYSDTIGGNIGDAIGPEMAAVGVSDIALGGGSEISVGGAVSDGVTGTAGAGIGGRDGNAGGVRIGGDVNGGKGAVDSGSAGSDRIGADGSVKVYRSRDSSSGGSGTRGGGNVGGGVNMSSSKSKHDLKYKSDDDDGTKIKRETYIHGNNGGSSDSNSNARVRGSDSASDVGAVSDKGSISSGRGNGASGSESVQFDNIQATVRDMLNLDRSDKGITSSGNFMSSSSSGNQRIERVDKVSDNAASSGSGSVDSSILGTSDSFVGIGGDGAEFIIAGNAVVPGSTDKRGSDVKIGDVVIAGNVGKSVNPASKVEGGYTGDDETSISFVVRDLTGWR